MKPGVLVAAVLVGLIGAAGCGDNEDPPPDNRSFFEKLSQLPGVTAVETPTDTNGFTYYVVHFTEPADHDDPDGASFQMKASLLHVDPAAPMVVHTTGYDGYSPDRPVELTYLLGGNQISIEHRFFADSRPEPADWSKLTIAQMAADQHDIIQKLRTIYTGAFITTGGSKGGMTAVYHRRFYPDDVDGTVPYVAPLSFAAPDDRYTGFLDTVGTPACRQKIRDLAVEMLANRRAMLEAKAAQQPGHSYTRNPIPLAVESGVINLEWAFWQYFGIDKCSTIPATTASDDSVWQFLDRVSSPSDTDDASVARFEPYYFQSSFQLGYPATSVAYLQPYIAHADAEYDILPPNVTPPTYDDGEAMTDIDEWVQSEGDRLLFVYGEWDPWSGGKFRLGDATDSTVVVEAQGTHGASLYFLDDAAREDAVTRLSAWTGVTIPPLGAAREKLHDRVPPRVPPIRHMARQTR